MLPRKHADMDHSAYSQQEEKINAMSHGLGAILAILGLIALVIKANTLGETLSAWIYALSLLAMFTTSSLYHNSTNIARRITLRKLDHIAIYLLIAGSYTPFLAIGVKGWIATAGLTAIWSIAFLGIGFKLLFGHTYPKLSIITYAVMGWFALFLIYPLYQSLEAAGFALLLVGGLFYSAGIPLYLLKSRHYSHALWHLCVVGGAACHFFAIYYYVY